MILCLDPGITCSGVALFDGLVLRKAGLARAPKTDAPYPARAAQMARQVQAWRLLGATPTSLVDIIVAEWPQVYQRGGPTKTKGDPNVITLPLAGVVSATCALFPNADVITYRPHEWKGTLDGDDFTERILSRLTAEEEMLIEGIPSLRHNAIDAVGLGLKYLGRLERHRAIRR